MRDEDTKQVSWLDPRIEVRASPIHGRGLFATELIRASELVIRWIGEVLPNTELDALKTRDRYDCAALSEDTIIVFAGDDPVIHGNHSCDPNLWIEGPIELSARREIGPGVEVTADYGMMSDDPTWAMPCSCGSPLCRGIIRGDNWKRSELQKRYEGHFTPYLARRFGMVAATEPS
ncbi:MAG: SET domain-containing protein [Chloroflexota bacterium]